MARLRRPSSVLSFRRVAMGLGLCSACCATEPLPNGEQATADPEAGELLEFEVASGAPSFIELSVPRVAQSERDTLDWDLAFEGYEIFTNGGVSGPGAGASFGPLSGPTFLSDTAPDVPSKQDEPGGAFLRWYAYDGAEHSLLSRFHVYGIRDGERFFKAQVLSYYGEQDGAAVAARYSVRYAEVRASGVSSTEVVTELDGTASTEKTECLDLGSGERSLLTAQEAQRSAEWHLCFRRESISVNGGSGGPRGVSAVDLDSEFTDAEQIADLRSRTAEGEQGRFDQIDGVRLLDPNLAFHPDGVVSAFSGRWLAAESDPPRPTSAVWFVLGADGVSKYLVRFVEFQGATEHSPGRIALRVKAVL